MALGAPRSGGIQAAWCASGRRNEASEAGEMRQEWKKYKSTKGYVTFAVVCS
jgi:hypothetical protein